MYILGRSDHIGIDRLVNIVYLFPVEPEYLGRPVYHRSTQVKHSLVRKSLDDDLITYPVAIPLRYSYCQFLSHIIRFT